MNSSEVRNVYEEIKREMRSQDPVLASVEEEKVTVARMAAEDREARVSGISSVVRTILEENNATCVAAGLNPPFNFAIIEANVRFIANWLLEHRKPAAIETVVEAVQSIGSKFAPAPPSEEQILAQRLALLDPKSPSWREECVSQIMALVQASPEEKDRLLKSFQARLFGTGPYLVTNETLKQKLANLQLAAQKREQPHEDLMAEVRALRTNDVLPPLPVKFSRDFIKGMRGSDLQNLIKKFGLAQINQRLAGE